MAPGIDVVPQFVVVARLGDFCRVTRANADFSRDPWFYLRGKLREIEEPLGKLKQSQLDYARDHFVARLHEGPPTAGELAGFLGVLDRYLHPGDYADAAIHLDEAPLADAQRRRLAGEALRRLRAWSHIEEDRKPDGRRHKSHEKLVAELWERLRLGVLERTLTRKPKTPRRRRMVLLRLRREVSEYCSVLHVPTDPGDTLSPFLLPRVEALVTAVLRLLERYR